MRKHCYAAVLALLAACGNPAKDEQTTGTNATDVNISDLGWLIGTWQTSDGEGSLNETWTKVDDKTFAGTTCAVQGTDTLFSEKIALEQRSNGLYYIPTIQNQNNNQPIPFRLVSADKGEFVFENKEHDFPQRIVYTQPSPDSLYAWIEGTNNGEAQKEGFGMKRLK